jgi:sensor histidine kinase YesM
MSRHERDYPLDREQQARLWVRRLRGFYVGLCVYALVICGLWVINLMAGGRIWAHFPMLGWGLGMLLWGIGILADGNGWLFGPEWEAQKVAQRLAGENLRQVSTEKQAIEAQLRLLQAQIEPHFLFNTLAHVQALIALDPSRAQQMLDNFVRYLRESLSASRALNGSLQQELALIRSYLDIIAIRMGERLRYRIEVDPSLAQLALAPMLLQPLVENAIKHGLEPKIEGGEITIIGIVSGQWAEISIADNGLGFSNNNPQGVGLANLRERLQLLYPTAQLSITELNPGTKVMLRLPTA